MTKVEALTKLMRCQATLLKVNREDMLDYFIQRYGPDAHEHVIAALVEVVEIQTDMIIELRAYRDNKEVRE